MSSVIPFDSDSPSLPDADLADMDDPSLYLNRELTWLAFNRRVLAEAENERTPLLERVRFLSIFDSNLDEFFMKRIGGLKQQLGAGLTKLSVDGRTPEQQLEECRSVIIDALADRAYIKAELFDLLRKSGIHIESFDSLNDEEKKRVRKPGKEWCSRA